jgi:hypothetical protein
MSGDPHSPTTAGPTPPVRADAPATEPNTVVAAGAVVAPPPAEGGSELPFGIPPDRPEILVGAAFAGGLVAAIILKRFGGD